MKSKANNSKFVSNEDYFAMSSALIKELKKRRMAESETVIPFMNGDFTGWDLYLAGTCEYSMRIVDGLISMLQSRNFVCAAQLLRAQIGVCMRSLAILACDDIDSFLETFFSNGRINQLKDRDGYKLTDSRLKNLLNQFDPTVANSYDRTSGLIHYSAEVINAMATSTAGAEFELNFGMEPNEELNSMLLDCGELCLRYLDLHLQLLDKIIEADEWYENRRKIDSPMIKVSTDAAST